LRIHDATFDDVGIYSCFARTSGGQSEETAWLTVMQPPSVRVEPRELFSVEGTTFTLKCITTGVPKPEVTWFFRGFLKFSENNVILATIFEVPRYFLIQNSTLAKEMN